MGSVRSDGPVLDAVAKFVQDAYGVSVNPHVDSDPSVRRRLLETLYTHYMTPRLAKKSIRGMAREFMRETGYYDRARPERADLRARFAETHGLTAEQVANAFRQLEFSKLR
jgi:hypothetical protein